MKVRLPQGMGGGPSNMQSMLKQAQKMQEDMAQKQAELEEREFTASSGGGVVEVVMNGKKELKAINIKPEIVDPDDVETLSDILIAAINEAITRVEKTADAEMSKVTGGMPGFPGMPF